MNKVISAKQAAEIIKKGSTLMVGGFLGVGAPVTILEELISLGTDELEIIANDTAMPEKPLGRLVSMKMAKKVKASHIGTNPATGALMNAGELEVELIPQGTLAERIRSAGFGLGGFLTPTGVGTVVAEGKQTINIDGMDFLLELPLKADIAIIKAWKADKYGNLIYRKSARNFNPLMASAASIVIAEVEEMVEVGQIDPDDVVTPSIFVNYLVQAQEVADGR